MHSLLKQPKSDNDKNTETTYLEYFIILHNYVVCFCYCSTKDNPFSLQDEDAPLVALYDTEGLDWPVAKWFVTIGAFFGFSAR